MAYKMEYAFQKFKKINTKKKSSLNAIVATLLLAAAVTVGHLGGGVLEAIMLGWHGNIPIAASEMVTNLREGMAFDKAVYAFCEEISYDQAAD